MTHKLIEEPIYAYKGRWSVDIVVRKRASEEESDEQSERQHAHYIAMRMKDVFMAEAGDAQ